MATILDLFNEKSQDIYKKFSPRTGDAQSQPYVSVTPDSNASRSRIKDDTRSVPVISTLRDKERISKFLKSSDGLLFITKQTLLQTGNTFVDTKLYNPLSPLANVVPFLHVRRNIPTKVLIPSPSGLLQNTTVNTVSSKYRIEGAIQAFSSGRQGFLRTVGSVAKSYLSTQLKNAANSIIPIPQTYLGSRPEYKVFTNKTGPMVFSPQPLNQRNTVRLDVSANIKNAITSKVRTALISGALNRLVPKSLRGNIPLPNSQDFQERKIPTFVQAANEFRDNFKKNLPKKFSGDTTNTRLKSKYFDEYNTEVYDQFDLPAPSAKTKLKDPYNKAKAVPTNDLNKLNYDNIIQEKGRNTDIIKFIFRDADNSNPVYFRALLSSIKESIKTEFNDQRYVGRTERFVTYGGAKRGLALTFNIVAFSQDEIEGMWSRVNYLSGLAFPKGVQNGFMVPPLFKMTIGGLYENQPCYIESLDYDFLDETITFDINQEVPFAINVTMQLSLLEKRSRFYNSPFYKITEDLAERQSYILDDETGRRLDAMTLNISDQIDANISSANFIRNANAESATIRQGLE